MKLPNPLKHWKIILLMAGIFLAGLVCGAVLTAGAMGKAVVRALSMEGWSRRTTRDLKLQLHLTAEQEQKVQAIAERYQPEVMALRNDTFARFGSLYNRFNADVQPLLTPEQADRFQKLNQERTRKFLKTFKLEPATNPPPSSTGPPAAEKGPAKPVVAP